MKKLLFILFVIAFLSSCNDEKKPQSKSPFKVGDMVYLKIDTTRVLIKYELGKFDEDNFLYRISFKNSKGEIIGKFVLSSEIFSK